ncbi:MAG: PKD domain-containing protein [Holophagae bacterium]
MLRGTLVIAIVAAAAPAAAQHFCDDPPVLEQLTGEQIAVDGSASEGHPTGYSWYVTPPGEDPPEEPTSRETGFSFAPDVPGLWSFALISDYAHEAIGGGIWSSETCVTVRVSSVVAAVSTAASQIPTDEPVELDGSASRWASGVTPIVAWQVDGLPFGACNGAPPPSAPADLECTIPADWLAPGMHTAGLELTDPVSGQSSLATTDFEVIEVIPLSVTLSWAPFHPDPGQLVYFTAAVTPPIPEEDLTLVEWDLGDGTTVTYTSCPLFFGSCLEWPHTYAGEAWYDVSVTVQTVDEIASDSARVEVGDPIAPPTASFTNLPVAPLLLETTVFTFDGSCTGTCQFQWDFGDGVQSTAPQPNHAWPVPNRYTVELTVTNDGGSDSATRSVEVTSCWPATPPSQDGACYGGPVWLTAPAGSAWLWNTGATSQVIAAPMAGGYWVDVDDGTGCWGFASATVVLSNCGDPTGDANLDAVVDSADLAALIPELTDGDGDAVVGAGGGDLTAPGGDVTGDDLLRNDDLLTVGLRLFD